MTGITVRLDEIATFSSGGTPSRSNSSFFEGDLPWITGADIGERNQISPRSFITEEAVSKSAVSVVPAGTLLLVTRTSVGKVAIADRRLGFSQDITAITPNHSQIAPEYLRAFLESYATTLALQARGATIQGVTRAEVGSILVPLPSLPEQRRIAAILDQADELRTKRRRALGQIHMLVDSVFMEMFAGIDGANESSVSALLHSSKGSIRTGPFGSDLLHSEFVDQGIAVLGIDNVVQNEFVSGRPRFITVEKYEQLRRYTVCPGDVLISIMGTVGRCVVVPDDIEVAINTKHLCCITLDRSKCDPIYLQHYFLRHPRARKYLAAFSKGAIMDGLNMAIIRDMPVVVPEIHQQQQFADRIRMLDEMVLLQRQALAKLDELFASLQYRAFTGQL